MVREDSAIQQCEERKEMQLNWSCSAGALRSMRSLAARILAALGDIAVQQFKGGPSVLGWNLCAAASWAKRARDWLG